MFWLIEADIHTRGTLSSQAVVFFFKKAGNMKFFLLYPQLKNVISRNENVGNLI